MFLLQFPRPFGIIIWIKTLSLRLERGTYMDYKGYECPICHEQFQDGEDIVVCPECGTPHHRTCYEENEACANTQRHKEHYSWAADANEKERDEQDGEGLPCPQCGCKNKKDALFCSHCGTPMTGTGGSGQQQPQQGPASPFGGAVPGAQFVFDPMAGINPEEEFADNVKASDLAAVVQVNTPYYLTVFNRIRQFGSSRFNFAAFLFSGGWMLYRKQYLAGAIFTVIVFATTVLSSIYYPDSLNIYQSLSQSLGENASSYSVVQAAFSLPAQQFWLFCISPLMNLLRFATMLVSGIIGNRLYYKHCLKRVKITKERVDTPAEAETVYQKTGGVNKTVVIVLLITYMVLNFAILYFTTSNYIIN